MKCDMDLLTRSCGPLGTTEIYSIRVRRSLTATSQAYPRHLFVSQRSPRGKMQTTLSLNTRPRNGPRASMDVSIVWSIKAWLFTVDHWRHVKWLELNWSVYFTWHSAHCASNSSSDHQMFLVLEPSCSHKSFTEDIAPKQCVSIAACKVLRLTELQFSKSWLKMSCCWRPVGNFAGNIAGNISSWTRMAAQGLTTLNSETVLRSKLK